MRGPAEGKEREGVEDATKARGLVFSLPLNLA